MIAELERRGLYHGETREDAALGVAAGAYLGGKLPAVVMQNSGLGVSLNALGSLHILYEMPCLLLVTWRGFEGKDAPEHLVMGERPAPAARPVRHPVARAGRGRRCDADVAWAAADARARRASRSRSS